MSKVYLIWLPGLGFVVCMSQRIQEAMLLDLNEKMGIEGKAEVLE